MSKPTTSKLKLYCLEVLDSDMSVLEKNEHIIAVKNILKEWSIQELKSYCYCKSMDTMNMLNLLEHESIDLSDKFDMDLELQEQVHLSEGVFKGIMGIVFWGYLWPFYRIIKHNQNERVKKCNTFGMGHEYDRCMINAKILYTEDQIKLLEKNMRDKQCDDKCKKRMTEGIATLKNKKTKLLKKQGAMA